MKSGKSIEKIHWDGTKEKLLCAIMLTRVTDDDVFK